MSKIQVAVVVAVIALVVGLGTLLGYPGAADVAIGAAGDVGKTVAGVLGGLLLARVFRPTWDEFCFGGWRISGVGGNWTKEWEMKLPTSDVQLLNSGDAATWKARLGSYASGGGFLGFSYDSAVPGGVVAPELTIDTVNKTVSIKLPPPKPR